MNAWPIIASRNGTIEREIRTQMAQAQQEMITRR
jgi:hypothetical protein